MPNKPMEIIRRRTNEDIEISSSIATNDFLAVIDPDLSTVDKTRKVAVSTLISLINTAITGGGADGTVTVVTDLQDNSGTLEIKTRDITITDGLITTIGAESAFTAITVIP